MSYTLRTQATWSQTQRELDETFKKWGVTEWATDYPKGARSVAWSQSESDRLVTLSYTKDGKQVNLQMGKQQRAVDNLRVLYLAVEAMRMNEKRGLTEVLQSAYLQLGSPDTRSPQEVLGVMMGAPLEVAEAAYKARARVAHPDNGGSAEKMKELNKAIEEIRRNA